MIGAGPRVRRVAAITALLAVAWSGTTLRAQADTAPDAPEPARAQLLLVAGTVVTMNDADDVLSPGAVAIAGDRILEIGAPDALRARHPDAEVVESPDGILLPGLVNTHTHAGMTLFRGFVDGLTLEDWLAEWIFPAEAAVLSEQAVRDGMRLALAEMIRGGTTTFADMYYFEDAVAEETITAGLRGVLGWTVIGFPVADAATSEEALANVDAFLSRFADDPLVTPAVAPHATYTCSPELLAACRELADRHDAPLLIHMSETRAEVADIQERFDTTPIGHADEIGLFANGPVVLAHVIHPTEGDLAILADRPVGVAHCPQSNMKLGAGVAPLAALRDAGIPVGLGTDGAPSNDDLDLFEEIDTAAKLQKVVALDPTVIDARTVVHMATRGGAEVLGMADEIGQLSPGYLADVILVARDRAGLVPMGDVWGTLAYVVKGSDVDTVVVGGRILMREGTLLTLDEHAAMAAVTGWRERIDEALASGDDETETDGR